MLLFEPTGGLGTGAALPTGGLGGSPGGSPYPVHTRGRVIVRRVSYPVRVLPAGVEARTYVGQVEVGTGAGVLLEGAAVAAALGSIDSTAIRNPTEEELAVLLLLPQVGGEA